MHVEFSFMMSFGTGGTGRQTWLNLTTSQHQHIVYVWARLTIRLLILGLQKLFIEGKIVENATLPYYKILKAKSHF